MWNAFLNGSGLQGGGGAGGGYVPSQGWEFVPCSRMARADRDKGKSRSPLRRISSPPTVFSHIYEPQFGASPGAGEGGTGTQTEILREQMWPGPEPLQQQQTHHIRLKKKFEDLKKRHEQEKDEWMREKEIMLREMADIQGGENRRILLDLKTVLEEVQVEVKREEERRSELQLQYTRDRCAWQLEKAELKCRISQLETREGAGSISGGFQSAAGPGFAVSQHCETPSLRREREEQRRLLADAHSTAMDLRCRLEHNEKDWIKEKAELLERFDDERREWENQLKDMQRKIEELYCEVRAKREGTGLASERQDYEDVVHRLSTHLSSTGSSLLSDNSHSEPLSSSSQSEPNRLPPLPGFGHNRNISGDGRDGTHCYQPTSFQEESVCEFNIGAQFTQNDHSQPELRDELKSRGTTDKEDVATTVVDTVFHGAHGCGAQQKSVSKGSENIVHVGTKDDSFWSQLVYGSDKKKNTTALNAALKEIARVSEELCSYQDEIRKKSGDKRNLSESLWLHDDVSAFNHDETQREVDEAPCDFTQIYDDLRALQRENWISLSPNSTWQANRAESESCRAANTDPDTQTKPEILSDTDTVAPPIPPRSSSWNLSNPSHADTELHIPESPITTVRKCHSPCVLVDRKCSSPSIVRKFEAMLQENEGKVFKDGVVTSCSVPANSNCNTDCCHNRWSCDTSKFTSSKLPAYGTVQKSFSEVNIRSAGKDMHSDYSLAVRNSKSPELQMPLIVKEFPTDLHLSSPEVPPASPSLHGTRRNIMLEQKTAEFNRTLFQAEMGRGVEEQGSFTVTDAFSVGCQPVLSALDELYPPSETKFQPCSSDVTTSIMGVHPDVPLSLFTLDSTVQNPEVQPRGMRYLPEGQEVRIKEDTLFELSTDQPQVSLGQTTSTNSQSPAHHSEVKHKGQIANSPSRKTQHRGATEDLFSGPVLPANTLPGQNVEGSSSNNENPHGAKLQHARAGVSLQQMSAENEQRQTQPGHQAQLKHMPVPPSQSDSSRPGPRMMNDHPWKPLTLAAYPRLEGSRSNYGALERILKNYESAARAQQNQSQKAETASSSNLSVKQGENATELDMLDMKPLTTPPNLKHTQASHTSQTHSTQLSSNNTMGVKGIQLIVQENSESSVSSSSIQKSFSRPARPANRRLPSRWASRSPTSSSSTSSSPSTTPVVPPSLPFQKHTSSFNHSHAFHIETIII